MNKKLKKTLSFIPAASLVLGAMTSTEVQGKKSAKLSTNKLTLKVGQKKTQQKQKSSKSNNEPRQAASTN